MTYFQVDKQIRRLDLILAYFEAKIKDTQIAMKNLEEDEQNRKYHAQRNGFSISNMYLVYRRMEKDQQ